MQALTYEGCMEQVQHMAIDHNLEFWRGKHGVVQHDDLPIYIAHCEEV